MTAHRIVNDPAWGAPVVRPTLLQRLEAKVEKSAGCWRWLGTKDEKGYGRIGLVTDRGKRAIQAQRAAWMVYRGSIPDCAHVLHRCDNPECVNPDHLFLGSNLDNIKDRMAKGRSKNGDTRGEKNGRAKLTEAQALAIRGDARGTRPIARDYGVSRSAVQFIKHGHPWKSAGSP